MKKFFTSLFVLSMVLVTTLSSVNAFTPPGLDKKDGLPPGLAKKKELPPGIQKRFIDTKNQNKQYETIIQEVDHNNKRIIIKDGTAILSLLVSDDAKIQLNGKSVTLDEINKDDHVSLKLDKENTVSELIATRDKETSYNVEGRLLFIRENGKEIIVYNNNWPINYKVKDDVLVRINGKQKAMKDLSLGMEVKLLIKGNYVVEIEAAYKDNKIDKIKGEVVSIDLEKREIVLSHESKKSLFRVRKDAVIKIDGINKTLENLSPKMEVEMKVIDGEVVEVIAKGGTATHTGRVMAIDTGKNPSITLEVNGKTLKFSIGKDVDLDDIEIGEKVKIDVKNGVVVEIDD